MRYFILVLSLFCISVQAKDYAVVPLDVYCFNTDAIIKQLKEKFNEEPIFVGRSKLEENVMTMIFVNQATGSYTVLGVGKDVACVLDSGDNLRYRIPKALTLTQL
jgi:hypothetical protein